MAADLIVKLAVNRIRALRLKEKIRVTKEIDSPGRFSTLSLGEVEQIIQRRSKIQVWTPEEWLHLAEADAKGLTAGDFKCTFYGGPDFPPLLGEIHDPPYLLFYRGCLPEGPALAVVGTRRPSGKARKCAFALGLEASNAGLNVVSGLARGVDTCAHAGALEGVTPTAGVLGCGIDRIYPSSSSYVARRMIAEGGCVISEYGTGVLPMKYHFPERNRIISGLSRGVVVVEAPERSGALITADFALGEGRDLYVHEGCMDGPLNKGCQKLLDDGAPAVKSVGDIFVDWGYDAPVASGRKTTGGNRGVNDRTQNLSGDLEKELEGKLVSFAGEYFER